MMNQDLESHVASRGLHSGPRSTGNTLKVRVVDYKEPCLFYRKRGEEFRFEDLAPEGICPDLFAQIYPHYLSLLYDGKIGGRSEVLVAHGGTVTSQCLWRIQKKRFWIGPLIRLAGVFFRLIGRPKDLVDGRIVIELRDGSVSSCPKCPVRRSFSFNHYAPLWGRRFFCPAVFYTLYPFLSSARAGGGGERIRVQCPADNACVQFELVAEE